MWNPKQKGLLSNCALHGYLHIVILLQSADKVWLFNAYPVKWTKLFQDKGQNWDAN